MYAGKCSTVRGVEAGLEDADETSAIGAASITNRISQRCFGGRDIQKVFLQCIVNWLVSHVTDRQMNIAKDKT